ncbi:aldo/keto reductase [Dyella sp.]|uniref:aldo/keto reductase n=1 Tax=Dyella sp. TaxID=1869338 RepID=UPI002ED545F8
MHTVNAHGAAIPALGFGTFRMPGADVLRMVPAVLGLGYRHIDTAQIYGNEAEVGEAVASSGIPREAVFLTTKVWVEHYRHADFLRSVDESLRKLRTDHVDLLLLHWPSDKVPLAEQIDALNAVRDAGKTRHIGVSNFSTGLMAEASRLSRAPLVTNQVEWHPYLDQRVLRDAAREAGISLTAYYAMADGKVFDDAVLKDMAATHGVSVAQVVLRWLIQHQGTIALSKTVSEERARSNAAIFDFALTIDQMHAIDALARPDGRIVNPPGLAPVWD